MKIYDSDIRNLLVKRLYDTTTAPSLIIHELDVCAGASRIDVAVINDRIHGYEIKSEQDTLARLPSQIEFYGKIFDTVTIVTAEKHIAKVINIIPDWWGIYFVVNENGILELKRQRNNKINESIDILQTTRLLWKDELIQLLALHGYQKGVKSKTRLALGKIAVSKIDNQEIKDFVMQALRNRTGRIQ